MHLEQWVEWSQSRCPPGLCSVSATLHRAGNNLGCSLVFLYTDDSVHHSFLISDESLVTCVTAHIIDKHLLIRHV